MAQNIERELHEQISRLPAEQQRRLLGFARSLAAPRPNGGSGQALLSYAGTIAPDDRAIMEQVIDEGCETVNPLGPLEETSFV